MYKIPFDTNKPYAPYVKGYCFHSFSDDKRELVYAPEAAFKDYFTKIPGQITRDSPFGQQLYNLARTPGAPRMWLEIGTWNGLGTTTCILDGFAERLGEEPQLASVEIDPVLFDAAAANLKSHAARGRVEFYQGKLMPYSMTPAASFPSPSDLGEAEQKQPHFFLHYDRERALYADAFPFLPPFMPEVAVLDGGEYSGYLDWLHLPKSDLRYLCLDDANTTKNKKVISELGSEWNCIARGNDRNGWAIYKRIII